MSYLSALPQIASAAPGMMHAAAGTTGSAMSPGLTKALQGLGSAFSQMGQPPQDGPLPQFGHGPQFDPIGYLNSLGLGNHLGRLGDFR